MSGGGSFEADWLALRAPADTRARSAALTRRLALHLSRHHPSGRRAEEDGPARLVDLAAGTGANLRFLAPRLAAAGIRIQHWRLLDRDAGLLAGAAAASRSWAAAAGLRVEAERDGFTLRGGDWTARVRCEAVDLAASLDRLRPAPGETVVLTALLDLVSRPWVEDLAGLLAGTGAALLATITDDGLLAFGPRDPDDDAVAGLFAAHQRRDKGFGPALGPGATAATAEALGRRGHAVAVRRSAWVLRGATAAERTLQARTVEGIAAAAAEQDPVRAAAVAAWRDRRVAEARAGRLGLAVGHRDLFAQPSSQALISR